MTKVIQQMDMTKAAKLFFTNYFDFSGRASRGEFWWVYLALTIIGFVPLVGIFIQLVTFIGLISLTSRRLQDVGFSGWYQLIPYSILSLLIGLSLAEISSTPFAIFISVIVSITFIVFLAKPSIEEDNQWGKKPEHSTSNYSSGNNPKDW